MRYIQLSVAFVVLIGAAMMLHSPQAVAQVASTGSVIGVVVDASGNPAVDCIVTITPNAQKMRLPKSATTDKEGKFKIESVPAGEWNMNVRSKDLKSKAVKSFSVTAGKETDVGKLTLKKT